MFLGLLTSLLLCGAAAAGSSPMPQAQQERVLVVPLFDDESPSLTPLYRQLEAEHVAVAATQERSGVDLPLTPELHRPGSLDDARSSFVEARRALMALQVSEAEASLQETRERLLRLERPTDHRELFAELLLARAELLLARGDDGEAERELRLLARLEPHRRSLNAGLYAPSLVSHYEAARHKNLEAQRGRLRLSRDSTAFAPSLLLDGVVVDTPFGETDTVVELPVDAGPHLVSLLAPGRVPKHLIVEVHAARELALTLETTLVRRGADEARQAALAHYRETPTDTEALQTLLSLVDADTALLLTSSGAKLWRPAAELAGLPAYDVDDPGVLARAVAVALLQDERATQADVENSASDEPWGGWAAAAAIGGVVLLGGASLVGALWLGSASETPVDPPPRPVVITGFGAGP